MDDLEMKLKKLMMAGLGAVQRAADKGKEVAGTIAEKGKDVIDDLAEAGEKTYHSLKETGADAVDKVRKALDENEINFNVRKKADKLRNLAQEYADLDPQERALVNELYATMQREAKQEPSEQPTFTFVHNNINVIDLDKSLAFYKEALGLREVRRNQQEAFTIVFLEDGRSSHKLELTWLRDWDKPKYDLGDNEIHLAFVTDDFEAAHALHTEMGVIVYENKDMGIYFIADPDGYWLEVIPQKR